MAIRSAIGEILWYFAWIHFECSYNNFQLDSTSLSPLQKNSNAYEPFQIKDYHNFDSPVYVLDVKLQPADYNIPK